MSLEGEGGWSVSTKINWTGFNSEEPGRIESRVTFLVAVCYTETSLHARQFRILFLQNWWNSGFGRFSDGLVAYILTR